MFLPWPPHLPIPAFSTPLAAGLVVMLVMFLPGDKARAQEQSYALTIHSDRFEPNTLEVKAGAKFKLVVKNAMQKAAEFESSQLRREKIIPAGGTATINIGPLSAGTYPFFDDFNKSTKGTIIAK
jgi:plastocyanin